MRRGTSVYRILSLFPHHQIELIVYLAGNGTASEPPPSILYFRGRLAAHYNFRASVHEGVNYYNR